MQPHDTHNHAGRNAAEEQAAELLGGIEGRESPGEGGSTGGWKATTPDASLMSDSPESSVD